MSTGAKVALGVGALAAGVALFGAEEYPQEFLDEFYDFDSNPTADTQDEETLAIAYAAWKHSKENRLYESETNYSRIYEATSGDGYISHNRIDTEEKRMVELRHDQPVSYYNWNSPYDVDESDVKDEVRNELGDEPGEGAYGATVEVLGSKFGENGQKYVEVDVDMNTDYGESRFMGLAAETFEARTTRKSIYNPITDESQYDNPTGKMLITPDGKGHSGHYERDKRKRKGHKRVSNPKKMDWDNAELGQNFIQTKQREKEDLRDLKKHGMADTVSSPSPSGPSSVPEPAEATGSEPSNENFSTEGSNMKMALGILGVGVGAVALLGGDRIKKIFDKLGL